MVTISGGLAYVADGWAGMPIFDVTGCPSVLFADGFESATTRVWSGAIE